MKTKYSGDLLQSMILHSSFLFQSVILSAMVDIDYGYQNYDYGNTHPPDA